VYCAEYCGKNHSEMLSKVIVHDSPTTFKSWMEEANDPTRNYAGPKQWGEVLYKSRGCNQCHTVDGSTLAGGGPSWKNLFGEQTTFTDGTTAVADEEYIRDSILYPAKHIVQGYTNIMPSFLGSLNERDVNSLVAYMKSISEKHDSENISWKDIGIEASSSEQPTQDPAGAAGEQPVVPTGEAPIVPGEGATE
jgi:cytochrome c oxidase subunit 2